MAALKLASLVLRGVAVRCDRVNVELRRETSYQAGPGTPEIPFSLRHPSQGYKQEPFGNPADRPDHRNTMDAADLGAGRSLGLAGVLRRSMPTTLVGRTASRNLVNANATRSVLAGEKPPVQAKLCRSVIGEAWCKPALRTPPASTWGRGIR